MSLTKQDRTKMVAQQLCRMHFARKQHYGACTVDGRLNFLVSRYWHNWVQDADAVIKILKEKDTHGGLFTG